MAGGKADSTHNVQGGAPEGDRQLSDWGIAPRGPKAFVRCDWCGRRADVPAADMDMEALAELGFLMLSDGRFMCREKANPRCGVIG